MGEAIEQRAGEASIAKNACPFFEWKIGCDDRRSMFMTLAEYLEEQFRAGLRQRRLAQFVDDGQFDGGELGLDFERTP